MDERREDTPTSSFKSESELVPVSMSTSGRGVEPALRLVEVTRGEGNPQVERNNPRENGRASLIFFLFGLQSHKHGNDGNAHQDAVSALHEISKESKG